MQVEGLLLFDNVDLVRAQLAGAVVEGRGDAWVGPRLQILESVLGKLVAFIAQTRAVVSAHSQT